MLLKWKRPLLAAVIAVGLIASSATLALTVPAQAQGVAAPPTINVELGSPKRVPSGVAAQLTFSFEQGSNFADKPCDTPMWMYSRDVTYPGQTELVACGFSADPTGLLTDPDGQTQTVSPEPFFNFNGGWRFVLPMVTGLKLGQYTLTLSNDTESLSRTWTVRYPDYPTTVRTDNQILVMGFAPGQTVTVRFYGFNDQDNTGINSVTHYWDSYSARVDAHGAVILSVTTTPSAPFASMTYEVAGYDYADLSWRRYDDWRALNDYSIPDVMIQDYYNAINMGWYDMSWEDLSEHYKDKYNAGTVTPHDFSAYLNWWKSVKHVDLQEVNVTQQDGNQAKVVVRYSFTMQKGGVSSGGTTFTLIFSPTEQRWLFYDQT